MACLAESFGSPQAAEVAELLLSRALLRIPAAEAAVRYLPRGGTSPTDAIFLTPVWNADAWLPRADSPALAYVKPPRYSQRYGAYYASTRSIYLPAEWELNLTWLGVLLLHEGLHALDHRLKGDVGFADRLENERRAQRLEYEVLRALYGDRLSGVIARLIGQDAVPVSLRLAHFRYRSEHLDDGHLKRLFGFLSSEADYAFARELLARGALQVAAQASSAVKMPH